MKRIITILLLGFYITSFAQDKKLVLKANGLTDPDLRLLYIGVDNPIFLENNSDTNIFLSMTHGSCKKWMRNDSLLFYIARPNSGANETTINILKKTPTDTIKLDTVNFTVLRIPDPRALFGNLADTQATVNTLLLQNEIKALLPCYFDIPFYIYGFTIAIVRLDGTYETIRSYNNMITDAQKQIIKSLKPGDLLWVENITSRARDCNTRQLACLKIRVKLR